MNKIIDYKIKKNYIKYEITKNIIYIEKIYKLLFKNTEIQYGGLGYDSIDSIKLILNNIDLIIFNLDYFNNIIKTVKYHDELMIKINKNYIGYDSSQNILDYINKIYKNIKLKKI